MLFYSIPSFKQILILNSIILCHMRLHQRYFLFILDFACLASKTPPTTILHRMIQDMWDLCHIPGASSIVTLDPPVALYSDHIIWNALFKSLILSLKIKEWVMGHLWSKNPNGKTISTDEPYRRHTHTVRFEQVREDNDTPFQEIHKTAASPLLKRNIKNEGKSRSSFRYGIDNI